MADKIYGINDLLKQYPLVEKTFDRLEKDIANCVRHMGGKDAVSETPKRIIDTVVNTLDGTDDEKQALIIASMYSACGYSAFDADRKKIKSESVQAEAILDSFYNSRHLDPKGPAMPTDAARCAAVWIICAFETMLADDAKVDAQMVKYQKSCIPGYIKRTLPNLNAPKLEKLFQDTMQKFLTLQPKTQQKTVKKNRGGPAL